MKFLLRKFDTELFCTNNHECTYYTAPIITSALIPSIDFSVKNRPIYLFAGMVAPNACLIKVEKVVNNVAIIDFNFIWESHKTNYLLILPVFRLIVQNHQH